MHNALELFDEQIISKILLIYVNDKTYEYDNVFQIDDFCIILLKRRFLRYFVQKQGELTVSVLFGRAVHCTVHD